MIDPQSLRVGQRYEFKLVATVVLDSDNDVKITLTNDMLEYLTVYGNLTALASGIVSAEPLGPELKAGSWYRSTAPVDGAPRGAIYLYDGGYLESVSQCIDVAELNPEDLLGLEEVRWVAVDEANAA